MTFTLTGFSTVKREGIELTGSFTATVNADMKVGAVDGDDHGHRRDADRRRRRARSGSRREQRRHSARFRVAKVYTAIMALVPGVTASGTQDVGRHLGSGWSSPSRSTAGAGTKDGCTVDGIGVGAALNGSGTGVLRGRHRRTRRK